MSNEQILLGLGIRDHAFEDSKEWYSSEKGHTWWNEEVNVAIKKTK